MEIAITHFNVVEVAVFEYVELGTKGPGSDDAIPDVYMPLPDPAP